MPLFRQINRDEPERIFIPFQNNEGATLNADQTIQLDLAAASVDGVRAVSMRTGNLFAHLGIVDAAVTDGNFGLVQTYGYRSTSRVFQTNTSIDTGVALVPVAGQAYLQSVQTTITSTVDVTLHPIFACLLESIASAAASATVSRRVWIRAMVWIIAIKLLSQ